MKRITLIWVIMAAVFMLADVALANQITLYETAGSRYGTGGPFTANVIETNPGELEGVLNPVSPNPPLGGIQFTSFCLEITEIVELGKTYGYTIDDFAANGGANGQTLDQDGTKHDYGSGQTRDYLDPRSAFLYYQYRIGGSIGSEGPVETPLELKALQAAFWDIEQEQSLPISMGSDEQELAKKYVTAAGIANWQTIGPVVVLNLYKMTNGLPRQSQLALRREVPEPATMLLLGLGLVGLAGIGRKFKR